MAAGKSSEITQIYERNQEATLYVGNLDLQVDEATLWELFVQCGIVRNVHIPRDKITGQHANYGFVEFESEADSEYALKIMSMVKLYGKPIRCNKASQDRRTQEIGANIFVGNLDEDVDEKLLFDTFSTFGVIVSAKVMRDPDNGSSKNYGFVSFDSFQASDACLAAMNGQFLCNRPIHVSYAYKKDTRGERHGSAAERLIAANRPSDKIKPPGMNFVGVPNPLTREATSVPPGLNLNPILPPGQGGETGAAPEGLGGLGTRPSIPSFPGGVAPPPSFRSPLQQPVGGEREAHSFASAPLSTPPLHHPVGVPPRSSQLPPKGMSMPPPGMTPLQPSTGGPHVSAAASQRSSLSAAGDGGASKGGDMPPPGQGPPLHMPMPSSIPGLPPGLPPPPMFFAGSRPGFALPPGMPPLPGGLPPGLFPPPIHFPTNHPPKKPGNPSA